VHPIMITVVAVVHHQAQQRQVLMVRALRLVV